MCHNADDENAARLAPADEAEGAAQREGSHALEAFLDSAPDPLRARRPSSNQVRPSRSANAGAAMHALELVVSILCTWGCLPNILSSFVCQAP